MAGRSTLIRYSSISSRRSSRPSSEPARRIRRNTRRSAPQRLLAAVLKVAFDDIPGDPTRNIYRQGGSLGHKYKHWFRAKFLQQLRLFFRYQQSATSKVIVLAWVNDNATLRASESATDAYAMFQKMLKRGNPPDNWNQLVSAAAADGRRLKKTISGRNK